MYNRKSRFIPALFAAVALTAAVQAVPTYAAGPVPAASEETPSLFQPLQPPSRQSGYRALPNCRPDRLERYAAWSSTHPEASLEEVVAWVNMDLDNPFYTNTDVVQVPDSLTVLVNKYHALPSDYIPQLEALGWPYGSGSLHPDAAAAFRSMADAAREEGITLQSVSAYRSYSYQNTVYHRYLSQDSQSAVDTYSARPGFSEHQTALALDINTASLSAHFENTPAYAWLVENCAQYGFILRYPQGKEHITGYTFEPWHYRYVGRDVAEACMSQGLTFEEYLAQQPTAQPILPASPAVPAVPNLPKPGIPII